MDIKDMLLPCKKEGFSESLNLPMMNTSDRSFKNHQGWDSMGILRRGIQPGKQMWSRIDHTFEPPGSLSASEGIGSGTNNFAALTALTSPMLAHSFGEHNDAADKLSKEGLHQNLEHKKMDESRVSDRPPYAQDPSL